MKTLKMLVVTIALMSVMLVPAMGTAQMGPIGPTTVTQQGTVYVYITRTGTKYHRRSCRYVKRSRRKVTLRYAKRHHYGRCKVCKPPR